MSTIYHTGILLKTNDDHSQRAFTLDFSPEHGPLSKLDNLLDTTLSKYHWHCVDVSETNFVFDAEKPFASFTLTESNVPYFVELFSRITDVKKAPMFMRRYHAIALSHRNTRMPATNCRFGALYIMIMMLFEGQDNLANTEHLTFHTLNLEENLSEIKSTLLNESDMIMAALNPFLEKRFKTKLGQILKNVRSEDIQRPAHDYLAAFFALDNNNYPMWKIYLAAVIFIVKNIVIAFLYVISGSSTWYIALVGFLNIFELYLGLELNEHDLTSHIIKISFHVFFAIMSLLYNVCPYWLNAILFLHVFNVVWLEIEYWRFFLSSSFPERLELLGISERAQFTTYIENSLSKAWLLLKYLFIVIFCYLLLVNFFDVLVNGGDAAIFRQDLSFWTD